MATTNPNWMKRYVDSKTDFPIHFSTLDCDLYVKEDGSVCDGKYQGRKITELEAVESYNSMIVPQLLEMRKTDAIKGIMEEHRQPIASGLNLIVLFDKPTKSEDIGLCSTLV